MNANKSPQTAGQSTKHNTDWTNYRAEFANPSPVSALRVYNLLNLRLRPPKGIASDLKLLSTSLILNDDE